jgi:hypothetical protein
MSYREFDTAAGAWILPTTTPVQFEPEPLKASVRRLLAADPTCIYLTHYGRVADVARLGGRLLSMIDAMVDLTRAVPAGATRLAALQEALQALYVDSLRAHGCTLGRDRILELIALDIGLNAQGLAIWLDRDT